MDKPEALQILRLHLERYRSRTHRELMALIDAPDTLTATGSSGIEYQIEIQAFWDAKPGRELRVLGSIDDGGLRAFVPLCDGFIISPDGSLIGE